VPGPPAGFDVQLDPELPPVRADAAQLERAIANVLENEARFAGDEPVSIRARAASRQILLRISDRGPGIAREPIRCRPGGPCRNPRFAGSKAPWMFTSP
jgi:signal transduction histidine kinase